jgi:hypothetical protein
MTWRDLGGAGVSASVGTHDSNRFGVPMGRVVVGYETQWNGGVAQQLAGALQRDEQILVVRYPAAMSGCPGVLAASGRSILAADNLVYWEGEPEAVAKSCGPPVGGDVVGGDSVGGADLDKVVAESFRGYVNHYSVNPMLPQDLALEGYVEWARQSPPDSIAVLCSDETPVGVATWVVDKQGGWVEILLAGLVPTARGRGMYSTLLGHVARRTAALAIPRMIISTQASNVRVQRAWVRAGLRPFATVATVHAVRSASLG